MHLPRNEGSRRRAGAKPKTRKTAWANIPRFPAEYHFALRHFLWNCSPGAAGSAVPNSGRWRFLLASHNREQLCSRLDAH
jgi:hypothetical protein